MADPQLSSVLAIDMRHLRVTWDSVVGSAAMDPDTYTLTPVTVPAVTPIVTAVERVAEDIVDLELDIDASPGDTYNLSAEGVEEILMGWLGSYFARGIAKAGITDAEAGYYADEMIFNTGDDPRWSGTLTPLQTEPAGVLRVIGASGSGETLSRLGGALLPVPLVSADGIFYLAARIRIASYAADSVATVMLSDGAVSPSMVGFGYVGSEDTAHFVGFMGDGTPVEYISSAVGDDALWHDIELWYDGAKYYLAVDDETPVEFLATNPATGLIGAILQSVGGAASSTHLDVDKLIFVFPQPA